MSNAHLAATVLIISLTAIAARIFYNLILVVQAGMEKEPFDRVNSMMEDYKDGTN